MAHHKRRKPRKQVRCNLCTDARIGNSGKDDGRRQRLQRLDWRKEHEAEEREAEGNEPR
jgi:hypothetical protein